MEKTREYLINVLIIIIVIALCMFIFIKAIDVKYKAQFIMRPCELCRELNPHLEECFAYESIECKDAEGNLVDKSLCGKKNKLNLDFTNITFATP